MCIELPVPIRIRISKLYLQNVNKIWIKEITKLIFSWHILTNKEQTYDCTIVNERTVIPTLKGNNCYLSEFILHYLQELSFLGVTAMVTMQQWARWIYLDDTKIGGLGVCVHQFRVANRPDYYVVVTQKLECPHQIYCIKRILPVTWTIIHLSPGKRQINVFVESRQTLVSIWVLKSS